MKTLLCSSAIVFASLTSIASAQDVSGAVTLGFGSSDISDVPVDLSSATLDGRVNASFGNGVLLGARADVANINIDDTPDVTASVIGASLGYAFGNGARVGGYVEQGKLSFSPLEMNPSVTSYGLSAGYSMANFTVDGFVGRSETNPDLPAGIKVTDYGVVAKYTPASNLTFGGNLMRTHISGMGDSVDVDMIGVAGVYGINEQWAVFGGVSNTSVMSADLTTFGLGASYDMAALVHFPMVASLELARTKISGYGASGDMDTIRLGFTVPFGASASKVPLNSAADAVLNPTHSVVTSTLLSAF